MASVVLMVFMILPIVCEAITELVGSSTIFYPFREFIIGKKIRFFAELMTCKYCISVWVAAIIAVFFFFGFCDFTMMGGCRTLLLLFLVHRLSNLYHLLFDILKEKRISAEVNRSSMKFMSVED